MKCPFNFKQITCTSKHCTAFGRSKEWEGEEPGVWRPSITLDNIVDVLWPACLPAARHHHHHDDDTIANCQPTQLQSCFVAINVYVY